MKSGNNHLEKVFNEIVVASFEGFQIAIPSGKEVIPRKIFSSWVPLPQRIYDSKGVLIWNGRSFFSLSELRISNLFKRPSPFPEIRRLAKGIPISFEVRSQKPLPLGIKKHATLSCCFLEETTIYHSIFRNIRPQRVKVIPCWKNWAFTGLDDYSPEDKTKNIEESH
ncbi:MAG: hypothetical protein F6K11_25950 [Leptolyngbya sp. SIO3F4]|nr:hypothetical protein [Leptolyngbya sp. SIO3F4]